MRCTCSGFVALLRGINVGGKNPVPMAELRACLTELGATDVATYIQSGNVLFDGGRRSPPRGSRIEPALTSASGTRPRVVVLSHAELRAVVDDAPAAFGREPERFREDVVFLKPPMTAATAREQMRVKDGVDTVVVGDGVVYVRGWRPGPARATSRSSSGRPPTSSRPSATGARHQAAGDARRARGRRLTEAPR